MKNFLYVKVILKQPAVALLNEIVSIIMCGARHAPTEPQDVFYGNCSVTIVVMHLLHVNIF